MSSKFGKSDKLKGRFAQSNINLLYKGNASETQSKPIRSGGFQLVGKLQGTKRNPPPPPWVPSINAEMGGQSTRVNIVPPGGSGWGTGPSNTSSNDAGSVNRDSDTTPSSTSILKDITKPENTNGDSDATGLLETSQTSLVSPHQKPFFAVRSSKPELSQNPHEKSSETSRSLASKSIGPTVPFYQRSATSSTTNQLKDIPTNGISAKPNEPPASKTVIKSTTPNTGWAAVTTEEPDFQERVNFSDDDEEQDVQPTPVIEPRKESPSVTETPWTPAPIQSVQSTVSTYARTAWDQPATCFNPAPPHPPLFSVPFAGSNDNIFPSAAAVSAMPMAHGLVIPSRDPVLQEHSHCPPYVNSEAKAQAQREERTLAYKTAITRAQMARKKPSADMDPVEVQRKDQASVDSPKSNLADSGIFSQSILQAGAPVSVPSIFPIHASVSHVSQQRPAPPSQSSMNPLIATMGALYNPGFPNVMHSAPNGGNQMNSQIKPPHQPPITNSMLSSSWNQSPYQAPARPTFQEQSVYHLPNSTKLPTDQDVFYKPEQFLMEQFAHQAGSKNGYSGQGVQSLPSGDSLERIDRSHEEPHRPPYTTTIGNSRAVDNAPFHTTPPRQLSEGVNRFDNDLPSCDPVIPSHPHTVVNGPRLRIAAHADGTRTAFTPPVVSVPSTSESVSTQPQQQHPHITPLMELDLSGKWSEKDFGSFPPPIARGEFHKSWKSARGGSHPINLEDKSSGFFYNGAQQNRPPKDVGKRPTRVGKDVAEAFPGEDDADLGEEESGYYETTDDHGLYRGASGSRRGDLRRGATSGSGTYPRRGRGTGRFSRSVRGAPAEYDDYQEQNNDHVFDARQRQSSVTNNQQREKLKGERSSGYKCGNRRGNDHGAPVSSGNRIGRGNFSRSGPYNRRYVLDDGAPQPAESQNSKPRGHPSHGREDETYGHSDSVAKHASVEDIEETVVCSENEQPLSKPDDGALSHRGGGRGGRRGGAGGPSQRRDRNTRQSNPRRHNNNNNHRRHPDDDDDEGAGNGCSGGGGACDYDGGRTTARKSYQQSGSGGGSNGRGGNTNSTESTTTQKGSGTDHRQMDGKHDSNEPTTAVHTAAVPTTPGSSIRPRLQAHSVTLTSDLETWETASEGLSSSLLGASPGASFAEARPNTTSTADDDSVGFPPKQVPRVPLMAGEVVPLMSINAEAPPSYSDNRCFLDSPPTRPSGDWKPAPAAESAADYEDAASVVSSVQPSEDGFMEVRSKSSKKQQKAKKQQQKSSVPQDEKAVKLTNLDNLKGRPLVSPKSAQTKVAPPPSSSKTSNKKDVVDKQKPAPSNVTPKKPTTTTVGALPSVNAWLKPLQETITEKAAAAAAARVSKPKPPINTVVVNSSSSAVATTAPTTATTSSSSQSWSVVVGSRSTTSGTSVTFSNGADIKGGVQVQPKEPNQQIVSERQLRSSPTSVQSNQHPLQVSSVPSHEKPELTVITTASSTDPSVSVVSTTQPATSANVCKVRPQKQPYSSINCNHDNNNSSPAPPPHTVNQHIMDGKQGMVAPINSVTSQTFKVNLDVTGVGMVGPTTMPPPQQHQQPQNMLRRQQLFSGAEWLSKTCVSSAFPVSSCSPLFDHYGAVKEMEHQMQQQQQAHSLSQPSHHHQDPSAIGMNPVAAAAAAMYLQQQQQQHPSQSQPFGNQRFQPPQAMMGFGLPDLSVGSQPTRSQLGMNAENYFTPQTAGPFQANQPQLGGGSRGLYQPVPPPQQPPPSQQRGGFPPPPAPWQQQHQSQQEAAAAMAAAAAAAAALWPNSPNYTPPPPPHHPHHHLPPAGAPPYVGVIGGDRPALVAAAAAAAAASSRAGCGGPTPNHHQQQQQQASLYNTGGGSLVRGGVSVSTAGGLPFCGNQQASQPGGLYAPSPTHHTPPPPHPLDPGFSFNGGLANSSIFSHQHGSLLPPQHRHHQGVAAATLGSRNRPITGDPSQAYHTHPHPVFIPPPAAAPFPSAAALPMSSLTAAGLGNPSVSMAAHGIHY